jgi:hypothetical protein
MSGYAASSPYSKAAFVPPLGTAAVQVGTATYHFLNIPMTFKTWEFIGIAFLIFVMARHWGRFVNDIT